MIFIKPLSFITLAVLALFPIKKSVLEQRDMEEKFIKTELFFGLNRIDGSKITDSEWEAFADTVISKVYTKGATILKSDGRWLDGDKLIKEESRLVVYFSRLYEMSEDFSAQVDTIREKYKRYYQQQAVLRTDEFINASF